MVVVEYDGDGITNGVIEGLYNWGHMQIKDYKEKSFKP